MTDLLDEAIAKIRQLCPERQEEAALALLAIADEDKIYHLSAEEYAEVFEGLAEIERGEMATGCLLYTSDAADE